MFVCLFDNYVIDLYLPDYGIAVEYDEPAHNKIIVKDRQRETYIRHKLGCQFVRATPETSIYYIINAVHTAIKPITNYQMAPSKRGAGGGSATHKEPT